MITKQFRVPLIGDGQTMETAFRPYRANLPIQTEVITQGDNYYIVSMTMTDEEYAEVKNDPDIVEV